jgi:hypothetical protein
LSSFVLPFSRRVGEHTFLQPEGRVFIRPSSSYAPGIPEMILSAIGNSYLIADVRI